ncbi:MAG TPA: hypothetical protein VMF65_14475 [Acidimicrobiales bacterium]|nr:hypothetical protein [Acidimicrobiales bacterium]
MACSSLEGRRRSGHIGRRHRLDPCVNSNRLGDSATCWARGARRRSLRDLLNGGDALLVGPEEWEPAAGDPAALFDVDTPADLAQLGVPQ